MKSEKQIYGGVTTFAFWYIDKPEDQKGGGKRKEKEKERQREREGELLLRYISWEKQELYCF